MAVDKKSDHVGNHGGAYSDIYGHSRNFTYIDHDRHTSRTQLGRESASTLEEKQQRLDALQKEIKDHNDQMIEEILALPAVNAVRNEDNFIDKALYEEFIIRSVDTGITWNEQVLREACTLNHNLCRELHQRVWRHTVKEQHWFEDLSHEEMLSGKWKELT